MKEDKTTEEVEPIDHEYTDNIVCPYCGYTETDSWEISANNGERDCHSCGKRYEFERIITIDYSTAKIKEN